ncbi:zinc finger BED domain-containing protein RICESLEEPER 2-like [Zingiber officinale]|uniref:zinc finger BED domain-containing protein RICESLEEPER 2-like n=1 Tax=Zingiber officinale TaxID=94328 RepID=UPI001C4BD04A|nr:zinc finger BED domain-containing protein RICESLEEPER 2-like [Zingiber officinale]
MDVNDSCLIPQSESDPTVGTKTTVDFKRKIIKRKAMKPRSEVWDHFIKFTNDASEIKAKCKYCDKKKFCDPYRNGTTSLRSHITSCKKHPDVVETIQAQLSLQSSREGEVSLTSWKFDQDASRKALARMIIMDELPFKFVEREGFKTFMAMKRILNFCPITSHKGEAISLAIENCLRGWGIDRIFTITVDNASSNDVAINSFRKKMTNWGSTILKGEYVHIRCVAHIINLIVADGLKDINQSVMNVRNAIKYVKQSSSRLSKFKECVEIEKIESKNSLCLDVPTRWNSTFLMLNTAQKFERAFDRFDEQDPCFKLDLQYVEWHTILNENGEMIFDSDGKPKRELKTFDGKPTSIDWTNVRHFASLLQVFYELTLKVSGSLYVTSNTFAHEISYIFTILKEWQESDDLDVYSMGIKMKNKFDKYWGDPEKMNKLLYIAVVLDPRHKLDFVEFMLIELYGDEKGERVGKIIKDTLFALYKNYKEKMEPQCNTSRVPSISESVDKGNTSNSMSDLKRQTIIAKYKKQKSQVFGDGNMSELDKYLNEIVEEYCDNFDILGWWRQNCHRFPILAQIARDVLAIPISTVASESAFSTSGRILDCFRSSLTPKVVESLICTQDWLRLNLKPLNIEEILEDVEKLESEFSKIIMDSSSSTTPAINNGIDVTRDNSNIKPLTEYDGISLHDFALVGMKEVHKGAMVWESDHDYHVDQLGCVAEEHATPTTLDDHDSLEDPKDHLQTTFESIDTQFEEL